MEIDRAIRALSRTPAIKDKICEYIQRAVRGSFRTHVPIAHQFVVGLYKSHD
jgi:hypothetical protein